MNQPAERGVNKAVDSIQQRLTSYACGLNYDGLPPEAIHAAKVRVIDTLGALIGGFFGEPCRIARNLAAQMPNPDGATVIGTRMKTTPDMAAFVNATTARYVEMNDIYHWPGSYGGHPSDVLTPVLAVAEHAQASGREFITGVVLAYEVYLRISDVFHNRGSTTPTSAAWAPRWRRASCWAFPRPAFALHLDGGRAQQHSETGEDGPPVDVQGGGFRTGGPGGRVCRAAGAGGHGGPAPALRGQGGLVRSRGAGTLLARHHGRQRHALQNTGYADQEPAVRGTTISSILAAEKVAPLKNIKEVKQVTVEVYKKAKERVGTGEHRWNPDSRETADHSIPYVVAATLMDGTVTPRSFNDAHLWNPELRALMQKIEVVENEEFTQSL